MTDRDTLKVGELARRTGLTVRTLHHYDAMGLLSPSARTRSGHRLYGAADVRRLQQILSLRALGLTLEEVARWLERPDASLLESLEMHLEQLAERIAAEEALRRRLGAVVAHLRKGAEVTLEEILDTLEATTMYEKYYTPEQLERLRQRREALGEERIQEVEAEWGRIFATVRDAMEAGTDPASADMRAVGRRARELVEAFTGGDPGIRASLDSMYRQEGPAPAVRHGAPADPELWSYLGRVMAAAEGEG